MYLILPIFYCSIDFGQKTQKFHMIMVVTWLLFKGMAYSKLLQNVLVVKPKVQKFYCVTNPKIGCNSLA